MSEIVKGKREKRELAEREGFEPSVGFPLHTLSKRAPSTTRTSLRASGINSLQRVLGGVQPGARRLPKSSSRRPRSVRRDEGERRALAIVVRLAVAGAALIQPTAADNAEVAVAAHAE